MNEAKAVYISEYYLTCRFVILTLRFRLKFPVTSLNINCHRWSDSQISQRPLLFNDVTRNLRRNRSVIITKRHAR